MEEEQVIERKKFNSEDFHLKKRLIPSKSKNKNDVFINMSTSFNVQLIKCQKLIESGNHKEIVLHGLGKAIKRTIELGLELEQKYEFQSSVNTSSVVLTDDIVPFGQKKNHLEAMDQNRIVSSVQIRLFR